MRRRARHGQSTLEYAILVAVVAAAAIGMQVYVKRGIQGRQRQAADQIGDQFTPFGYTSKFQTVTESTRLEGLTPEGFSKSTIVDRDEKTTRTSTADEVVPAESTLFP